MLFWFRTEGNQFFWWISCGYQCFYCSIHGKYGLWSCHPRDITRIEMSSDFSQWNFVSMYSKQASCLYLLPTFLLPLRWTYCSPCLVLWPVRGSFFKKKCTIWYLNLIIHDPLQPARFSFFCSGRGLSISDGDLWGFNIMDPKLPRLRE